MNIHCIKFVRIYKIGQERRMLKKSDHEHRDETMQNLQKERRVISNRRKGDERREFPPRPEERRLNEGLRNSDSCIANQ